MDASRTQISPLRANRLTITRGDKVLLTDIQLTLEAGSFAALVGPSGCGKTSLLRVLALLDKPESGSLQLWGQNCIGLGDKAMADGGSIYPRLNYVPQTLGLWPHMTIRENLLFAAPRTKDVDQALQEFRDRLELSANFDRKPAFVSQGQRQRAALIRALLLKPSILLLDEITAALDGPRASVVWKLLQEFSENGGAILASTHDLRLAAKCPLVYRIANCMLTMEGVA